jgi:carboxypeptidase C (cathepsin A)
MRSLLTDFYSVGVGFSYADFGETVGTTEDASKDIYAFVAIFFATFTQFEGRPFHLSGESYGVRCYQPSTEVQSFAHFHLTGTVSSCLYE